MRQPSEKTEEQTPELPHRRPGAQGIYEIEAGRSEAWGGCGKVIGNKEKVRQLFSPPSKMEALGFPGGAVVKNPPANAGDTGSSPGPGRSHMPRSS